MDEVGKYHAKWNRPSPKTKGQIFSLISGWRYIMMGGWQRGEKNEGTLDGVEDKGVGVGGNGKTVEWNRQYYPIHLYDYMNGVNIHCVQP